jgi:aminopeptidase
MDDRIERLARLVVDFGANVQPGQLVDLAAGVGEEELVHAVAAMAYRRGARFVDVVYFDPWLKRARVEHVSDELLGRDAPDPNRVDGLVRACDVRWAL